MSNPKTIVRVAQTTTTLEVQVDGHRWSIALGVRMEGFNVWNSLGHRIGSKLTKEAAVRLTLASIRDRFPAAPWVMGMVMEALLELTWGED